MSNMRQVTCEWSLDGEAVEGSVAFRTAHTGQLLLNRMADEILDAMDICGNPDDFPDEAFIHYDGRVTAFDISVDWDPVFTAAVRHPQDSDTAENPRMEWGAE